MVCKKNYNVKYTEKPKKQPTLVLKQTDLEGFYELEAEKRVCLCHTDLLSFLRK